MNKVTYIKDWKKAKAKEKKPFTYAEQERIINMLKQNWRDNK